MQRSSLIGAMVCVFVTAGPAMAATNPCTNGSFEELNPAGFPVDWAPVGSVVESSSDAHSGQRSLRLMRAAETTTTETGLNRASGAAPNVGGAMIDRRSGGIEFWYKAVSASSAELCVFAIPMNADGVERTDSRRAKFAVPPEHVGDGQWHQARLKYNFTQDSKVRWVHFAARIVGRAGELLLDDVSHVDRVGVILQVGAIRLEEDAAKPGEQCLVRAKIENAGDAEAPEVRAVIQLPDGLTATPGELPIGSLAPDRAARAVWTVKGIRRAPQTFDVLARSGDTEARSSQQLQTGLTIRSFGPVAPVAAVGRPAVVECVLKNTGQTVLANPVCEFRVASETKSVTASAIPPGRTATVRISLTPKEQTPRIDVSVRVLAHNSAEPMTAESQLAVGAAIDLPGKPGNPEVTVDDSVAVLANRLVRLAFRRNAFGFGPGELSVASGGSWRTVAWLPRLSRVVSQDGAGQRIESDVCVASPAGVTATKPGRLQFTWTREDADQTRWNGTITFELAEWAKEITARYELKCSRPAKLLAFEGPMIYALQRDEAIFPGLEWLVDDELSSDSLDIAEDHPHRIRYVVHPNMVTIPAVGLRSDAGAIGLLWDLHQRWDGERDRPAVVFASPDRFGNQRSHLVGLFVPTVPEFVDVNGREAARPYPLKAGQTVRLEATILADSETDSPLAAVERWVRTQGIPDPAPLPRGTYERELEFSMQAYLTSLWVPESRQWWQSKGAGALSTTGRPREFVVDLMTVASMTRDAELRRQCLARAEEVRALLGGEARVDAQRFANRADLAYANPDAASNLLAARAEDGSWRFDADQQPEEGPFVGMDYYRIGPDEAVEVGTCARKAYEVLRYARISGDWEAFQRMQDTLVLMERFRVPRAAQVWEVPVHTPDVLAAADAVDAYVEAYRISRQPRWLQDAVLWAKRGLPFIYLWSDPDKPYLLGGSIPVFGATWHQGSWFGRPVQWNGLRYAVALWRLSEFDDSYPWRKIAELVIRSALHQQEPKGENVALWPDSISAIDGEKSAWIFAPHQILDAIFKLTGRDPDPSTMIVGQTPRQVHVTAGGKVTSVSHQGTLLSTDVSFPPSEQGIVLIANVSRPDTVYLDGKPIRERIDVEQWNEPGWRYDAGNAYLAVRVTKDGPTKVRADGVLFREVRRLPWLAKKVDFQFSDSLDGWLPAHDISEVVPVQGALFGRVTGPDPYLVRRLVRVAGDDCPVLQLNLRVTAGSGGQVFWTTESSPEFDEDKSVRFSVIPDGRFHEYRLELRQDPHWAGQIITGLRLDPCGGARSGEFNVDYVRAELPSVLAPKKAPRPKE